MCISTKSYRLPHLLLGMLLGISSADATPNIGGAPPVPGPIQITRIPQLFLHDDRLIEEKSGLTLVGPVAEKYEKNPVIRRDQPWEAGLLLWGCVLHDVEEKIYKMWYEVRDEKQEGARGRCLYATSKDGLNWQKPILNVIDYKGSTQNNIVFRGPESGRQRSKTYWVTKDYSDSDPGKRYKMMYHAWDFRGRGVGIAHSPDGIHWKANPNINVVGSFDTQNIMFWDDRLGLFVGYFREWVAQRRWISRATSYDGYHWTKPVTVHGPDELDPPTNFDIYAPGIFKLSRAEDAYIMYTPAHDGPPANTIEGQIGVSRDGISWHRFRHKFLPKGAPGSWDAELIYPVASEATIQGKTAIYYFGVNVPHVSESIKADQENTGIGVAFIRDMGFAGLRAGQDGGRLQTRQLVIRHARYSCFLNADAKGGTIRTELCNADGKPIPGFTREDAVPITGNGTRQLVKWKPLPGAKKAAASKGPLFEQLREKAIRLNIYLEDATIYGFEFSELTGPAEREGVDG